MLRKMVLYPANICKRRALTQMPISKTNRNLGIKLKFKKMKMNDNIADLLGKKAAFYLDHVCQKITKDELLTPGKYSLERSLTENSNRNPQVLRSLAQLYGQGNLGGTGYLSILPVDQGIEHSAVYSFYKNPDYFDP